MKYEVYLDTVFLIQFVMDYCVLMLTASVMRLITSRLRIIIAALAGAVGSCLLFIPIGINGYLKIIVVLVTFGLIMTGIAFRVRGKRQYLSMLLMILAALFLLGGAVQWLMSMFGSGVPTMLWVVFLLLIYILLQSGLYLYRKQKSLFVPVTLTLSKENGTTEKISVIALKDTGNRLREEHTGKGVCILEDGIFKTKDGPFYQVAYHTLGNEDAKMNAQVIPQMMIHTKEGDVVVKDVMLALYPGKISQRGSYHMILHPEYLKED